MALYPVIKFGGVTMQGRNGDWFRPDNAWLAEQAIKAGKALSMIEETRNAGGDMRFAQPESLMHFVYRLIERQRNLARAERLKEICRDYILPLLAQGVTPVVVVSAFDWATDKLVHQAEAIVGDKLLLEHKEDGHVCKGFVCYEYARLLMSGELRGNSGLALALNGLRDDEKVVGGEPYTAAVRARSLTGREAGIITEGVDGRQPGPTFNVVKEVRLDHLERLLKAGIIPVVAGFQGYYPDGDTGFDEVSTLDRGGSNLTAVALAKALGETECVMYSDVPGIYDWDPRMNPEAKQLQRVTPADLLTMEERDGKYPQVIQKEAVQYAEREGIDIWVKSGFEPGLPGTLIECRK